LNHKFVSIPSIPEFLGHFWFPTFGTTQMGGSSALLPMALVYGPLQGRGLVNLPTQCLAPGGAILLRFEDFPSLTYFTQEQDDGGTRVPTMYGFIGAFVPAAIVAVFLRLYSRWRFVHVGIDDILIVVGLVSLPFSLHERDSYNVLIQLNRCFTWVW
jgi:hypothetical protein